MNLVQIVENELLIEALRTKSMENPYWDFENEVFYDKPTTDEETN